VKMELIKCTVTVIPLVAVGTLIAERPPQLTLINVNVQCDFDDYRVYPEKQTIPAPVGTSHLCHNRK
jgi:hypothetical protein